MKLHVPSWLEFALALLPRRGLDAMEISGFPLTQEDLRPSASPLRIAIVKSEYCAHIYARPGSSGDLRSLAISTLKTFGPLSLLNRHKAEFFIIRLPADPDCQIWREFYANDPDQAASSRIHENFRTYRPAGQPEDSPCQGDLAVDPESVDWSCFDAVFVQDLCLPPRITKKFPKVLWSYWIGETGSPSFKNSFRRPAEGYQLYLNGSSRRWRVRPALRSHVLEFPYIVQDSETHARLGAKPWRERSGVLLEINTARTIPAQARARLERITPVVENVGTPEHRLQHLHHSKYFVQIIPKRLWGNSLNEAVAAGCLGIANPTSMPNNRSLLMPGLTPSDWDSALSLLQALEADQKRAEEACLRQQRLADWLLCERPLRDWEARFGEFRKGRPK